MIGVYYYPEQWPEDQWEKDIQNIKQMGMKHIHLAEFAWIHLEPKEGDYDFAWLDRIIKIAEKNHLNIILGTPTATPPIWMSHKYPNTLMVRQNGQRVSHGSRAHRCVNSVSFNSFAEKMTQVLGKKYGSLDSVKGWQIDNELGHYTNGPCYCEDCLESFRVYLNDRYGNIKRLNKAWGGDFWSQNYQEFDQIQFPNLETLAYVPNEHALLDFKRFFSISLSRFLTRQSKVLRPHLHNDAWITHNFMKDDPNHFPGHVKKGLDLYTLTIYPVAGLYTGESDLEPGRELHRLGDPMNIALNHDLMRSYNGRWGIMEQQPGQVNWGPCNTRPYPGTTRLWLWTAIAHGASFLDTYRYRQPLSGAEQYHEGMVGLDGETLTQGGRDFSMVAADLETFTPHLDDTIPFDQKKAAILMDWDSLTMLFIHPQNDQFNPRSSFLNYYSALKRLGFDIDILHTDNDVDLNSYSVVCTGLVDLLDDNTIDQWKRYIGSGGHLILTLRTGTRYPNGHFPQMAYGQRVTDLTGAKIVGYDVLPDPHQGSIELINSKKKIKWHTWAEQYEVDSQSRVLAIFSDQFYKGDIAAFKKRIKKGSLTCIGFDQKEGINDLVYESLAEEFPRLFILPDQTLFRVQGSLGIFLNYNDQPVEIPKELLAQFKPINGKLELKPAGISIMKLTK